MTNRNAHTAIVSVMPKYLDFTPQQQQAVTAELNMKRHAVYAVQDKFKVVEKTMRQQSLLNFFRDIPKYVGKWIRYVFCRSRQDIQIYDRYQRMEDFQQEINDGHEELLSQFVTIDTQSSP